MLYSCQDLQEKVLLVFSTLEVETNILSVKCQEPNIQWCSVTSHENGSHKDISLTMLFTTWFFNIFVSFIGSTPLHLSVMARNETVFSLLLNRTSQPVDLNIRTLEGHTALWFALLTSLEYKEGSFAMRLLKKGASPSPVSVDCFCCYLFLNILDFKLLLCSECRMLSSG